VGNGATSVVCKAALRDDREQKCAIKKIKMVFQYPDYARRALRELRLQRFLSQHPYVRAYFLTFQILGI
jgi:hypothetical protein